MKRSDCIVVLAAALVTMVMVLAVLMPGSAVVAESKAVVPQAKLFEVDGVSLTFESDKAKYKAGDKPVFKLKANYPENWDGRMTVQVTMNTVNLAARLSRKAMPVSKGQKKTWEVVLDSNKTVEVVLPLEEGFQANGQAMFSFKVGDKAFVMGSVSVTGFAPVVPKLNIKQLPNTQQQIELPKKPVTK